MTFKVGDKVETTKFWNNTNKFFGVITSVSDEYVWVAWPDGLGYTYDSWIPSEGYYVEPGMSDKWPVDFDGRHPALTHAISPSIKPGDRVRIVNSNPTENGMSGTVLFSKPTNGDYFMVLITDGEFLGYRMSYKASSLVKIQPVVQKTYHEAIDNLLPFV